MEEKMGENAHKQGERFREEIRGFNSPIVELVRGKGLLNAVVIDDRSTDQTYVLTCYVLMLIELQLFLCSVVGIFHIVCCIRKPCVFLLPYSTTILA